MMDIRDNDILWKRKSHWIDFRRNMIFLFVCINVNFVKTFPPQLNLLDFSLNFYFCIKKNWIPRSKMASDYFLLKYATTFLGTQSMLSGDFLWLDFLMAHGWDQIIYWCSFLDFLNVNGSNSDNTRDRRSIKTSDGIWITLTWDQFRLHNYSLALLQMPSPANQHTAAGHMSSWSSFTRYTGNLMRRDFTAAAMSTFSWFSLQNVSGSFVPQI